MIDIERRCDILKTTVSNLSTTMQSGQLCICQHTGVLLSSVDSLPQKIAICAIVCSADVKYVMCPVMQAQAPLAFCKASAQQIEQHSGLTVIQGNGAGGVVAQGNAL